MEKGAWILAFGLMAAASADASTTLYDDRSEFLGATGAANISGDIPLLPGATSVRLGSMVMSHAASGLIFAGRSFGGADWTPLLPGNEVAVQFAENVNVVLDVPSYALGFDFVEPMSTSSVDGCGVNPCLDSTFTVTLKSAGVPVDSFTFNAANDVATFVGWWSTERFDRVEIRENNTSLENEFFGPFYAGVASPVPAPPAAWMLTAGLALLGLRTGRGRLRAQAV